MANILEIIVQAKDEASRELEGISGKITGMKDQLRLAGAAATATGGLIVAGAVMSMKAAAEEEVGIRKLSMSMKNMGLSYEEVRGSLEAWIDTQQQKTTVSDSEQREALGALITMTGDLKQSQDLLTLAMDIAAGTGRDLSSITQTLGYALADNWGMVNRMIPGITDIADEEGRWLELRKRFTGQAEEYGETTAGSFKRIQNTVSDLTETIGGFLNEAIAPLIARISDVAQWIKDWAALNPALVKSITLVTVAIGILLVGLGATALILPSLISGFITLHAVMGPIGWIILAIAAAAAIAVPVMMSFSDATEETAKALEELRIQIFRTKLEGTLIGEKWKEITARGYLLKKEVREIARELGMTTAEFLEQMTAADMLEVSMNAAGGETRIYLKTQEDVESQLRETTQEIYEQAVATAELEAAQRRLNDSWNRFLLEIQPGTKAYEEFGLTNEDVIRFMAQGDKTIQQVIDSLKEQGIAANDVRYYLDELGISAKDVADFVGKKARAIRDETEADEAAIISSDNVSDSLNRQADAARERIAAATMAGAIHPESLPELEAAWAEAQAAMAAGDWDLYFKINKELLQPLGKKVWGYQHGGVIKETGFAFMHKGETVIPANTSITIPIYLDGDLIGEKFAEIIGNKARLLGA